ncbi:unnamed protein product [Chilo suppressalis]|uniref:G-patch domain-containing protein n=1 Tax=Chilo suppressalis TaxID=168631 RepID=A0ABN8B0Q5_CHISP|nr:unnamed protein product [Chilo suppressalis]
MAMLAAPRRKQKVINLRAKNNAWSNDTNKFGQRMLEKMGWSTGKGLGANEDGIVEHVVARYKNDEKGLGFEDRNDQWTKHEDDFNSLLSNLSNASSDDKKLHSGVSLEDKSKKSKARVHYHKFTRGKDLTRYSEKDLANIFGKKSLKNKGTEPEEKPKNEEVIESEQKFSDKGSMEDYFKQKMAAFQSKAKVIDLKPENQSEDTDYVFKGFSTSEENELDDSVQKGFSFYDKPVIQINYENGITNVDSEDQAQLVKKKKKKSKRKNRDLPIQGQDHPLKLSIEENDTTSQEQDININSETGKKSKRNLETHHEYSKNVKCKKKKSKCKESVELFQNTEEEVLPKKKKKHRNKEL